MNLEALIAREQVRDALARYTRAGDTGHIDALAACFAEDGILEVEGQPPLRGRAEIKAYFASVARDLRSAASRPLLRHHVANPYIELAGPQRARSRAYFLVVTEIGVDHWGCYRDELARFGAHWLFTRRRVSVEGAAPATRMAVAFLEPEG